MGNAGYHLSDNAVVANPTTSHTYWQSSYDEPGYVE